MSSGDGPKASNCASIDATRHCGSKWELPTSRYLGSETTSFAAVAVGRRFSHRNDDAALRTGLSQCFELRLVVGLVRALRLAFCLPARAIDSPLAGGSTLGDMQVQLAIGDFSRMTYLSVKALRHYHDVGILEPAQVDPASGYRSYDASQVPVAQVIRRFRDDRQRRSEGRG